MLVVYFLGAVWAAGSAVASGLFVPMLLIGSCVGRIVGLVCVDVAAAGGHGSAKYAALNTPMQCKHDTQSMGQSQISGSLRAASICVLVLGSNVHTK